MNSINGPAPTPATRARHLLPLTVWLCPDDTTSPPARPTVQPRQTPDRRAALTKICDRHRTSINTTLARHIISATTGEGDVITEAFTTNHAILSAAAQLDRRALACVPHPPMAQYIGAQLRATLPQEFLGRVQMRPCRADQMHRGVADHLGRVSLVIAAPPIPRAASARTGPRTASAPGGCPACLSDVLANTAFQTRSFLPAAYRILRPGGHLAVVTTARHLNGRLVDPAPEIIRQARAAGFRYSQHVIAVRVPVEGDTLLVQASPVSIGQLRDVRSRALPPAARVHADVCLLTRPGDTSRGGNR
ncbi:hypothetical protein GCM10022254_03190 [Actinomadura meridiana]|uniref:Uncharacterized protein n=1 Tax=Actinomadura meridiana TaxID=559626 RepID=A0ABP8BRZ1_9ACTN